MKERIVLEGTGATVIRALVTSLQEIERQRQVEVGKVNLALREIIDSNVDEAGVDWSIALEGDTVILTSNEETEDE